MIGCGCVESKPHLCDIRQLAEHPGEDNPREKMLGKNVLQNQPDMTASGKLREESPQLHSETQS